MQGRADWVKQESHKACGAAGEGWGGGGDPGTVVVLAHGGKTAARSRQ